MYSQSVIAMMYSVAGCFIVAFSQLTGKIAADEMSPVKVCALRFGLAAPLCYGVHVAQTKHLALGVAPHRILIIAGIGMLAWGIGAYLFYLLMKKDSMHRVVPVCNAVSVWTVVLAILFLGEPFFAALGVVMVLLVIGIAFMSPSGGHTQRWAPAMPLAVFVALTWAVNLILTKVYIQGVSLPAFVFIKMVAATLYHVAFFPFDRTPFTRRGFIFSLYSAVLLVVSDIMLMAGVRGLPASIFSPVFATVIPFGFILSVVMLKEKPVRRNWAGMMLIFLAAAICGYYGAK